ncbi:serine/arginine repetitive matrix protein 2-like [Hetaerina americana]|uniref:serine/arginine repetitive matrix protein 2-like n=1 Tax=Hetaerina americana TaxID=62018 RepID=UPI003A7F39BC
MGNSTSSVALPAAPVNSFPRHHQRYHAAPPPVVPPAPVTKVLPVPALPDQRALLRSTQNGAILHQGGTISGRRFSIGSLHAAKEQLPSLDEDLGSPHHRRRNTMGSTGSKGSKGAPGETRGQKSYLELSDGSPDVKRRHQRKQQQFYGSEPDLRAPIPSHQQIHHHQQMSRPPRMRKKYKAPAPPPAHLTDGKGDARDSPQRARLFRTRAETSQMNSASSRGVLQEVPANCQPSAERLSRRDAGRRVAAAEARSASPVAAAAPPGRRRRDPSADEPGARSSRRDGERGTKWLSSPEFQAELLRVTLDRGIRKAKHDPTNSGVRSRESSGNREAARVGTNKDLKPSETKAHEKLDQESRMPKSQPERTKENSSAPAPTPFYFGMEGDIEDEMKTKAMSEERDKVEKFAERVRQMRMEEVLTEEVEWQRRSDDEEEEESGIDLCLRPTLPKKQPQVPRFSPIAAWRLLGSPVMMHSPEPSIVLTDSLLPEKVPAMGGSRVIEMEPRGEKSADSGISGDASPGPGVPILRGAPPSPTVWTPQQDLAEEESSSEDGPINVPHPPHVLYLSLSLPRATDGSMWRSPYTRGRESSLDKLKRSVSGAIFGKAGGSDEWHSVGERPLDDNWSLGHCGVKRDGAQLPGGDVSDSGCMGRVMYLPQGPLSPSHRSHSLDLLGGEILGGGREFPPRQKEGWEDIAMRRVEEDFERGRALDRARLRVQLRALNESEREADRSVGYGPSSLPADVRYEPDGDAAPPAFERRLDSGDRLSSSPPPSSSSSPLPSSSPSPSPARRRRGTTSSSTAQKITRREWRKDPKRVPPPTRVLSEFRQQRRDYREPPKGSANPPPPTHQHIRHPSVVCDIPKTGDKKPESSTITPSVESSSKNVTERIMNGGTSGHTSTKSSSTKTPSDNYRRDFAHGSLPAPMDADSSGEKRTQRNSRSLTPVGRNENEAPDRKAKSNASSISSLCSLDATRRGKPNAGGNSHDAVSRDVSGASSDSKRNLENNGASTSGLRSKAPLFTSLQPYTPGKGYRPISFNPGNQTQKLAQSVS